MGAVEDSVAAVRAGQPVVLPTDTVYGLCADPDREDAVRRLYGLKRRPEPQPVALLCSSLDALLERVPELSGRSDAIARALLPGPFTLVLPNPGRRYPWLTGDRPEVIGVRVPVLGRASAQILARLGAVAATSANLHGEPDPARLEDVPLEIRSACGAVVDVGALPGTPSTVLDLTGPEPQVIREGAVPTADAIARVLAACA